MTAADGGPRDVEDAVRAARRAVLDQGLEGLDLPQIETTTQV
jgi:hypothetical protein